ncbi:hypothetical protein U1Q18_007084 [Sarracenia purpurea var. burkii]
MELFSIQILLLIFILSLYVYISTRPISKVKGNSALKTYPLLGDLPELLQNRHRFHDRATHVLSRCPTQTTIFRRPGDINGVMTANPPPPPNVEHMLKTNFDDENHHRHCLYVPEDVLIQILVRLPVKSLLRFKCVCHHWYALIQNPSFAHDHLQHQKRNNKGRLLLQHFSKETKQYCYSLFPDETLANNSSYHEIDRLPTAVAPYGPYTHLMGPCNGLLCLFTIKDRGILWNPSIREFRFLLKLGFGLDPLTGNYKVVLILYPCNEIDPQGPEPTGPEAMVHTIGTGTWRHLEYVSNPKSDLHKYRCYSASNSYLDGVCYWWVKKALVAFDMMKEVFREISGPDIPE